MDGQRYRTRRRSDLSQHFLRSRALAASLVEQSSITGQDLVVEIGPGRGMLTRELARRCRRLVAVEIDERLVAELRAGFQDAPHVELVHGDFLRYRLPESPYKVYANVPFGRTADIIHRLVGASTPPEDAYCVVQLEAAQRFAGGPSASETLSSLLLKPWWHVEIARRLRRNDFDPPPRVESVLLSLARRIKPLVDETRRPLYEDFVTTSFGRRGSTVRQCLRGAFTGRRFARLARDLRFDPTSAPSDLTFDQWLGLFRYLELGIGPELVKPPFKRPRWG